MIRRILGLIKIRNIKKSIQIIRTYGFRTFFSKVRGVLKYKGDYKYNVWCKEHALTEEELAKQRATKFSYEPKISILVPTFNTPEKFLREMIASVQAQTYANWELCIADGSTDDTTFPLLKEYKDVYDNFGYQVEDGRFTITYTNNTAVVNDYKVRVPFKLSHNWLDEHKYYVTIVVKHTAGNSNRK